MSVVLDATTFFPSDVCEFHFVFHIRPVVEIGEWLFRHVFCFVDLVSIPFLCVLCTVTSCVTTEGSAPLPGRSNVVSVLCSCTGTLMPCPPPKPAAEKISFSSVRLSLAAVPNNYLCFGISFSSWNFPSSLIFSVCTTYAYSLLFCHSSPSPHFVF